MSTEDCSDSEGARPLRGVAARSCGVAARQETAFRPEDHQPIPSCVARSCAANPALDRAISFSACPWPAFAGTTIRMTPLISGRLEARKPTAE